MTNHKLRIVLFPKKKKHKIFKWLDSDKKFVQGVPFELFILITNIGSTPSPEIVISNFLLKSTADNLVINSQNSLRIKQLNPGESIELSLDKMTIGFKGSAWASLDLKPEGEECEITSYQYDCDHQKDEPHATKNNWGDLVYIQGELEVLQQKTNNLILVLTVVTVIHSIFGMKESLKFLIGLIYQPLAYIAEFLGTLAR